MVGSRIRIFPIPDPGVKKAPDPGSATLVRFRFRSIRYGAIPFQKIVPVAQWLDAKNQTKPSAIKIMSKGKIVSHRFDRFHFCCFLLEFWWWGALNLHPCLTLFPVRHSLLSKKGTVPWETLPPIHFLKFNRIPYINVQKAYSGHLHNFKPN